MVRLIFLAHTLCLFVCFHVETVKAVCLTESLNDLIAMVLMVEKGLMFSLSAFIWMFGVRPLWELPTLNFYYI